MSIGLLGLAFGLSPAVSFDGTARPDRTGGRGAVADVRRRDQRARQRDTARGRCRPRRSPCRRGRSAADAAGGIPLRHAGAAPGQDRPGVIELEYAAEQGVPGAIWKLGRMYADGDGVNKDKARAYEYFRRLTNMHADESASAPNARFLANAFVTLGALPPRRHPRQLKADPNVAREMFRYAASYFADPEAQYYLGRLYLLGKGAPKDAIQAARWLRLSANKGEHRAQALLGGMLFKGEQVPAPGRTRAVLADRRQGRRGTGRGLDHRHVQQRVRAGQRK